MDKELIDMILRAIDCKIDCLSKSVKDVEKNNCKDIVFLINEQIESFKMLKVEIKEMEE